VARWTRGKRGHDRREVAHHGRSKRQQEHWAQIESLFFFDDVSDPEPDFARDDEARASFGYRVIFLDLVSARG
jgi:hypothetical protein